MSNVILVDISGTLYRHFFASKPLSNREGVPTNAVLGVSKLLLSLIEKNKDALILGIFDSGRHTWRNDIFPSYKEKRKQETPQALVPQFSLVREITKSLGLQVVELPGFESDDLIAAYALHASKKHKVTIYSSDKDMYQLLTIPNVEIWDPMKNVLVTLEMVQEKFGVTPDKALAVQALAGDGIDCIPGIRSVGVKTAAKLLNVWGSWENLWKNVHKVEPVKLGILLQENRKIAEMCYKLASLDRNTPLPVPLEKCKLNVDLDKLKIVFEKLEFKKHLEKATAILEGISGKKAKAVVVKKFKTEKVSSKKEALDFFAYALDHQGVIGAHIIDNELYLVNGNSQILQARGETLLQGVCQIWSDPGTKIAAFDAKELLVWCYDNGVKPPTSFDCLRSISYILKGTTIYQDWSSVVDTFLLESVQEDTDSISEYLLPLYNILKQELLSNQQVSIYESIDRKLIPILVNMETTGVLVDARVLAKVSKEITVEKNKLEKDLEAQAQGVNLSSPSQVGEYLFGTLKLKGGKKTKTGKWQTSADVLDNINHPWIKGLQQHRMYSKLLSTYTEALPNHIHDDGRIYAHIDACNTANSRLAMNDPNLQNIPIKNDDFGGPIRRAFVAPPNHVLISVDYSNIDLRMLATISQCKTMLAWFAQGVDIHTYTAMKVFKIKEKQVTPIMRKRAKAVNFGVIYGISNVSLARDLGITNEEATKLINDYYKTFPEILLWQEINQDFASKNGYVCTWAGRKLPVLYINDTYSKHWPHAKNQCRNFPISGSSSDCLRKVMILLNDKLPKYCKMLLQVHDELLFECPERKVKTIKKLIVDICENIPGWPGGKLPVNIKCGPNWLDMK